MHLLQSNSSRVHPGPELEDDDSDSIESLCKIPGRFVYLCYEKNLEFLDLSISMSLDSVVEFCDRCATTALAVGIVPITVTVILIIFAVVITAVLVVDVMGSVVCFIGHLYLVSPNEAPYNIQYSLFTGEDKRCTLHFKGEITQKNDMEASSEEALGGIEQNATTALLRELIQYYGQGDKAIDAACRAALVSVIPQEMNSARDCDGNSLLITCCQLGGEGVSDLVERLLNKGADPNVVNSAGASALHFASYHGDSITTGLLLKCGGDPTQIECMHGCTPLHYAASVGNMEVCEALILAGADIFAEDHHSYTGSKYAEEAGHTLLRDMLNKEGCLARQRTNDCGIWRRHIDEATGAGYHYNSLTGECFWNEDVVRLARVEEVEIPEAIKSWIDQEKRRVTLTTLLAQVDPRRIIEVDEIMETDGSADKLDRLIQSLKEEYKFDKRKNNTSCDQPQMGTGSGDARNAIEKCVAMGKKEEAEKPDEELQVYDAQTLDAEAKEQEIQQEIDILKKNLNDLRSKSRSGTAEAEVIQRQLSEIRAGGGKRSDLEVDLSILKTSVDAENGRLEELRKALEIKESEDVGRKRKLLKEHKLDEKERQNRLRKIEADSAEEIRCIEAEHNERMRCAKLQSEKDLEKTKNEFDNRICMLKKEKSEFETEAEDKLHALVSTRDELVASAENDKLVAKKANAYLLETRVKIQDAHGIVRAFRTSLATLTRESECSAALHNQLVDMKGSSRLVVKLKPSSKSAAAFVKDGSTGIARVDNKPHRTFDFDAVATEQSELYTHIQPLAVSVADGRAVALVVFGTRGSGKTYSLFGGGETDSVFRKSPGVPEDPSCKAPSADTPGSPQKIKKSKQDDEDIYPIAGVIPRFLRTLFSTIEEREVRERIDPTTSYGIEDICPILPF